MTLKSLFLTCATVLGGLAPLSVAAQVEPSMYGDKVKADIKVNYVRSLDEALVWTSMSFLTKNLQTISTRISFLSIWM